MFVLLFQAYQFSRNSTLYYYYLKNGNYVPIQNYITDSYATVDWDNKESGAKITATYSYLELVRDDSKVVDEVNISAKKALLTKYKIGGEEGTIALIGPKRMDYERVMTLLEYIKENLDSK